MYPDDRRYTKEHEWVKAEGDRARVGITDYAQNQLGDVVFLELPEVGRVLRAGETFGTVESVKAVSELYAPLAGEVVEVNSALVQSPEAINTDPHGSAWMVVLKPADAAAAGGLLDAAAYQALVDSGAK
jgi:glycine cleavage system H protein